MSFTKAGHFPTSVYYLSKSGNAELANGEKISGKFYYSSPFLSKQDIFYFYSDGISSQRKIPINEIKTVSFQDKTNTNIIYINDGNHLSRKLSNGTIEVLTTKVLRKI